MANTSYQNNIRSVSIGGWQFGFDARTEWSSISRSNNTITISGLGTRMRVNSGSVGATFTGTTVQVHTDVPNGTRRRNASLGSGTFARGSSYKGSTGNYSMTVGATSTSVTSRSGVQVSGGTGWTGSQSITIPAAGLPTGLTRSATSIASTTATLGASVSNWGNNCTAGSGQRIEYRAGTSGGFTNLAYTTSSSHTRNITGLTSNQRHQVRSYVNNGAGRAATSSVLDFYTLPLAPAHSAPELDATTVTVPVTQNNGGGAYTITKQYRYREVDGAWSAWTTFTGNEAVVTDLIPSVDYDMQLRSTTTAGSTEGSVFSLTTLPAAKLVMPDGSVVNAIPWVIEPDGTKTMAKVGLIQP